MGQHLRINKISLNGFRAADDLCIELDPRLNVFVGVNGAGKTTILDAAAILLSWIPNRIRNNKASGRPIVEQDIRNSQNLSELAIEYSSGGNQYAWTLRKNRKTPGESPATSNLSELNQYVRSIHERAIQTIGPFDLPLFAYFPVNRTVLDIPLRIRAKHSFDQYSASEGALTSAANFRTFFEWFREREDLENENRRYADDISKPEGFEFPDRQLQVVREALSILMPEFSNFSIRRNPLRMEVNKQGQRLIVNQLSDGEKCMMALIGDLARRMAISNLALENPLHGQGVVMIDEVDLHLHPQWQRMVVPKLLEAFPNCQFMISTHSPHVVTHVHPENVHLLDLINGKIEYSRPQATYGKTVERVLEDLMGLNTTRPENINKKIITMFDLISQGDVDQAKKILAELQAEIGDDPELAKVAVLIRRKELIDK